MRRAALFLVPLFLFACDRAPVAPDISPTFDAHAPPAESGVVTRSTDWGATSAVDFNSGFRSWIGVAAEDFCLGPDPQDFSLFDNAFVATGAGNTVQVLQGNEVYAEVWPAGPFDCNVFTTSEPIATGVVKFVRTDNDWFGDGGRTNAFGWRANGFLFGSDDAAYRFSETLEAQWTGSGIVVRKVRVSLHPIAQ